MCGAFKEGACPSRIFFVLKKYLWIKFLFIDLLRAIPLCYFLTHSSCLFLCYGFYTSIFRHWLLYDARTDHSVMFSIFFL